MIEEGRLADGAARLLSLAIKRKVINLGKQLRAENNLEMKIDLLSRQVSALSALCLVSVSVGGDGLLSKTGIISGLFTEEDDTTLSKDSTIL